MNNDNISREELKNVLTVLFSGEALDYISAKVVFDMVLNKIENAPARPLFKEDETSCYYCKYKNSSAEIYPCAKCKHAYLNRFEPEEKKGGT